MSFTEIIDGKGGGKRASVDNNNRLETFAITESRMADVSYRDGRSFLLTSDFIPLTTTASFSGVFYLKNTDPDTVIFIDKIRICGTAAVGVMGNLQTKFIKNPTTGTLITNATDAIVVPANLSSNNVLDADCYKGADSNTITDGTQFSQFVVHLAGHTIQEYDGALILEGGNSMSIEVKPNIATDVCIEIQCWTENK